MEIGAIILLVAVAAAILLLCYLTDSVPILTGVAVFIVSFIATWLVGLWTFTLGMGILREYFPNVITRPMGWDDCFFISLAFTLMFRVGGIFSYVSERARR